MSVFMSASSPATLANGHFDWNPKPTEERECTLEAADEPSISAQVSPCEGPIELCQLVVNDDTDKEEDTVHSAQRSTRTLEIVRTKLIGHMSQDHAIKRQSRLAVGHSEEELARRAELRRFRQQRIQDELDKDNSSYGGSDESHRSTQYLSPLIQLGQSGVGPRDTIEFTVEDSIVLPDVANTDHECHDRPCHSSQFRKHPLDLDRTCSASDTSQPAQVQHHEAGSTPPPGNVSRSPTASAISARRLAGCSLNTPRLDRVLGIDNDFDIRRGSHAWDDQSTLGVWLIAQGMRSRDCSVIRIEDTEPERMGDSENPNQPSHDMDSIALALGALIEAQNSSTELPPVCAKCESVSSCSNEDKVEANQSLSLHGETVSNAGESSIPAAKGYATAQASTGCLDNSSSSYPSAFPSFQPSPAGSRSNPYTLSPQDLETLELSPLPWPATQPMLQGRDLGHSEGASSYATAEEDGPSGTPPNSPAALNVTCPPSSKSLTQSTMSSNENDLQLQEPILQALEPVARPPASRKQGGTPLHSRFVEDFPTLNREGTKPKSFVTKLQNSFARLSRGKSDPIERYNQDLSESILPVASTGAPHGKSQRSKLFSSETASQHDPFQHLTSDYVSPRSKARAIQSSLGELVHLDSGAHISDRHALQSLGIFTADYSQPLSSDRPIQPKLADEPYHQARSRESHMPKSDGISTAMILPATDSKSEQRRIRQTSEQDSKSESSKYRHIRLPKQLENAMRTGIDKMMPSRRAVHNSDRSSFEFESSMPTIRPCISYNEIPKNLDQGPHKGRGTNEFSPQPSTSCIKLPQPRQDLPLLNDPTRTDANSATTLRCWKSSETPKEKNERAPGRVYRPASE
ncbi:hypothetical protein HIM_00067 [Hirsutella minnesotensis 3608]|nr:hypothetical protein HIM_00067 [Hirsutella minnesotensis 3608]